MAHPARWDGGDSGTSETERGELFRNHRLVRWEREGKLFSNH